ncbi:hypothetical protein [Spirilliplanes yamanashiensis]|uniref:Uncharacterized protein n=1 Tax=Spirilliplanes yamanashiensis TaxID=42233 RepID=A0A8J4DJ24_9ACTN|nr:hypothetical protein [Spirilliplanes yamanashiensis]MDP9814911.1 hypothetical protein [Spirilliplanes yamanashiensis]GIJ02565.1 hypothetical protein Sya03_19170 [Spirilliplanes yamanashiensis]
MSVRELVFFATHRPADEVADLLAGALGGTVEHRDGSAWLLVDTAHLVDGATGRFGGPLVEHDITEGRGSDDEWEASDAYRLELRLWQAEGPRIHPVTGRDIEADAAGTVFAAAVGAVADVPILRVRDDDKLISAALPGRGARTFPAGTSIYDWDEPLWDGYVVRKER